MRFLKRIVKRFFGRYKVKNDVLLSQITIQDTWFHYDLEHYPYLGWRDFEWVRKQAFIKCDYMNNIEGQ